MENFTHAGGVVFKWNDDSPRYLVVTARTNSAHWVLPKGHLELGETPEAAAIREVREETGILTKIKGPVGTAYFQAMGEQVRAQFFLMEYLSELGKAEPREKRWCTFDEGLKLLTFQDSRKLLKEAHQLLTTLVRET